MYVCQLLSSLTGSQFQAQLEFNPIAFTPNLIFQEFQRYGITLEELAQNSAAGYRIEPSCLQVILHRCAGSPSAPLAVQLQKISRLALVQQG
jgi:hypothetical protein